MTIDDFEFDELDELAAAYLDGEATAAEIQRVESTPDIRARVEEFRVVSEAVAKPVAAPSMDIRDAAVAAALAAVRTTTDRTQEPARETSEVAPVGSLDSARDRRAARSGSRVATIAKIAAAIMVVFLGLTVVTQLGDGLNDDEVASSITDAADDSTAAMTDDAIQENAIERDTAALDDTADATGAVSGGDDNADTGAANSTGSTNDGLARRYQLPDDRLQDRADYLGTYASLDEFIVDYQQATDKAQPQFVTPDEFNACDLSTLLLSPRAALYLGTATIDGVQRLVGLEPGRATSDADRIIVFEQTTAGVCSVTIEGLLEPSG